jgi:hypothetical protein
MPTNGKVQKKKTNKDTSNPRTTTNQDEQQMLLDEDAEYPEDEYGEEYYGEDGEYYGEDDYDDEEYGGENIEEEDVLENIDNDLRPSHVNAMMHLHNEDAGSNASLKTDNYHNLGPSGRSTHHRR